MAPMLGVIKKALTTQYLLLLLTVVAAGVLKRTVVVPVLAEAVKFAVKLQLAPWPVPGNEFAT